MDIKITMMILCAVALSSFAIGATLVTPITQAHINEATRLCEPHRGLKFIQPAISTISINCIDSMAYAIKH